MAAKVAEEFFIEESESDAEGGAVEVGSSDEEGDGARSRSPRSSPFSSWQWPQSYTYGLFRSFLLLLIMPGFYTCFGLRSELFNGGLQVYDCGMIATSFVISLLFIFFLRSFSFVD